APAARPARRARAATTAALALLLLLLAFGYLLQPRQATGLLLGRLGGALGLDITAGGANDYRLRGTPTLVLRDLVVREPGASTPLLRASRLYIALPWSTIRARGAVLDATRLELDAPVLDLPALQHWLATRPPTKEKRLPILESGLHVRDGSLLGAGWRIDDVAIDAPRLLPARPLQARLQGRLRAEPLSMPMDLALAIVHPDALLHARTTGFALVGSATVEHARDWHLPARLTLSGPLRIDGALAAMPARIGIAGTYTDGATRVPFALGLHGPLRITQGVALAPAEVVLHGVHGGAADSVPTLQGHAAIAWTNHLVLRLQGRIAEWPAAWPSLPSPLGRSSSPLPVALDYVGTPDFSQAAHLRLARDATRFDARFRLPAVVQWIGARPGAPLPPLDGTLSTPRLVVAGAQLEGVDATFDDEATPDDH
ncbi:MAG: hypothetical protein HOQ02_09765, partial [Lysobacter sp.]|nr:hypothetical protein [Lysobacter sp.]